MSLRVNLRQLDDQDLHLKGEVSAEELNAVDVDELIVIREPVRYDLSVEQFGPSVLVQGKLELRLDCECSRCLKPFQNELKIERWACNLALEGEDQVPIENDSVDLTPYIREDILLAFPQRPLCKPECSGLPPAPQNQSRAKDAAENSAGVPSQWAELDKLRLD
jgi:uncharacterized protein